MGDRLAQFRLPPGGTRCAWRCRPSGHSLPAPILQPAKTPAKTVGNAKKASKQSSGKVLTAGKDIKVRRRAGVDACMLGVGARVQAGLPGQVTLAGPGPQACWLWNHCSLAVHCRSETVAGWSKAWRPLQPPRTPGSSS